MQKDMLGQVVQKLVKLSEDLLGIVFDLLEKLLGPDTMMWTMALKRFLRKENPWLVGIMQAVPFDPMKFLGQSWSIKLDQDEESLALTEVDLSKVRLETGLEAKETCITGEEKLKREKKLKLIRLDARFFLSLWNDQKKIPEAWKEKTNGNTTYIFFTGTPLRGPDGDRYILSLYWHDNCWGWACYWLEDYFNDSNPSAVLVSSK